MLVDARKEFYAAAEDNIEQSDEDALYWGEMTGLTIIHDDDRIIIIYQARLLCHVVFLCSPVATGDLDYTTTYSEESSLL